MFKDTFLNYGNYLQDNHELLETMWKQTFVEYFTFGRLQQQWLEDLKNFPKNSKKDTKSTGRFKMAGPPNYESGLPATQQRHLAI
jgi:hypothetical protein